MLLGATHFEALREATAAQMATLDGAGSLDGSSGRLTAPRLVAGPRVGAGAFGVVHLVRPRDDPSAPPLALKVLSKAGLLATKQVAQVLGEGRLLEEAAGHPFVARHAGRWQDEGHLYLAT